MEGEGAGYFWAEVLKELGDDGEAADDNAGGELGMGPQAHGDYVVAYVGRLDDSPGVVGSQD